MNNHPLDNYGSIEIPTKGYMVHTCPNHEPDFMGDAPDEAIERHDDGNILVDYFQGRVGFDYGESGLSVHLDPASARRFAEGLIEAADYAETQATDHGSEA